MSDSIVHVGGRKKNLGNLHTTSRQKDTFGMYRLPEELTQKQLKSPNSTKSKLTEKGQQLTKELFYQRLCNSARRTPHIQKRRQIISKLQKEFRSLEIPKSSIEKVFSAYNYCCLGIPKKEKDKYILEKLESSLIKFSINRHFIKDVLNYEARRMEIRNFQSEKNSEIDGKDRKILNKKSMNQKDSEKKKLDSKVANQTVSVQNVVFYEAIYNYLIATDDEKDVLRNDVLQLISRKNKNETYLNNLQSAFDIQKSEGESLCRISQKYRLGITMRDAKNLERIKAFLEGSTYLS